MRKAHKLLTFWTLFYCLPSLLCAKTDHKEPVGKIKQAIQPCVKNLNVLSTFWAVFFCLPALLASKVKK